jgi:uncharacterized protein GlcG (DUF336 family)
MRITNQRVVSTVLSATFFFICIGTGVAQSATSGSSCQGLPSHDALQAALASAREQASGGFNVDMWATVVNRDGVVCAVAFTGINRGDQFPGSRVISAEKANTANAFSVPKLALSTANFYTAVQPGGSLYGLLNSDPVDTEVAYRGSPAHYGLVDDPMIGGRIGGVIAFGGGLALFDSAGKLVGGLGVSGDGSCSDHIIAWRTRHTLTLDYVSAGVSGDPARPDNIVYDTSSPSGFPMGIIVSGWGHPACTADAIAISKALPAVRSVQETNSFDKRSSVPTDTASKGRLR